jgi:hypothetical protein
MKFLIRKLGWDHWKRAFDEELAGVRASGGVALPFDPNHPPVEAPPSSNGVTAPSPAAIASRTAAASLRGPGIHPALPSPVPLLDPDADEWMRTNVRSQRQGDYATAVVRVPLGDVSGAQLRVLGELAATLADGMVRITTDQNALFRQDRRCSWCFPPARCDYRRLPGQQFWHLEAAEESRLR